MTVATIKEKRVAEHKEEELKAMYELLTSFKPDLAASLGWHSIFCIVQLDHVRVLPTPKVLGVDSNHSFQPSFFSITCRVPRVSGGFLKKKDAWKEWGGYT